MPGLYDVAGHGLLGAMSPQAEIPGKGEGDFGPSWPEVTAEQMKASKTQSRELTRSERAAIRRLVRLCANYTDEYGCLPLDAPCYMLGKWWTGGYCRYFQNAVLPLDPVLEAALLGQSGGSYKVCPVCGAAYIPITSQAYCSEACRSKGKREAARLRQRQHRYKNNR